MLKRVWEERAKKTLYDINVIFYNRLNHKKYVESEAETNAWDYYKIAHCQTNECVNFIRISFGMRTLKIMRSFESKYLDKCHCTMVEQRARKSINQFVVFHWFSSVSRKIPRKRDQKI